MKQSKGIGQGACPPVPAENSVCTALAFCTLGQYGIIADGSIPQTAARRCPDNRNFCPRNGGRRSCHPERRYRFVSVYPRQALSLPAPVLMMIGGVL